MIKDIRATLAFMIWVVYFSEGIKYEIDFHIEIDFGLISSITIDLPTFIKPKANLIALIFASGECSP